MKVKISYYCLLYSFWNYGRLRSPILAFLVCMSMIIFCAYFAPPARELSRYRKEIKNRKSAPVDWQKFHQIFIFRLPFLRTEPNLWDDISPLARVIRFASSGALCTSYDIQQRFSSFSIFAILGRTCRDSVLRDPGSPDGQHKNALTCPLMMI